MPLGTSELSNLVAVPSITIREALSGAVGRNEAFGPML